MSSEVTSIVKNEHVLAKKTALGLRENIAGSRRGHLDDDELPNNGPPDKKKAVLHMHQVPGRESCRFQDDDALGT